MSLTTNNGKIAVMEWCQGYEPGFMLSETTPFSQGDKQQLIWGVPEVLWDEASAPAPAPAPAPATAEPSAGAAGWPSHLEYKKRKQAVLEEDQEIMELITKALPELLRRYYG